MSDPILEEAKSLLKIIELRIHHRSTFDSLPALLRQRDRAEAMVGRLNRDNFIPESK